VSQYKITIQLSVTFICLLTTKIVTVLSKERAFDDDRVA
jgi:hypothetical protein